MTAGPEPAMGLQEAADALGVHYQTAYGWVRQGTLAARKAGRDYRVSRASVVALAGRRQAGRSPRDQIRVRDWAAQANRLHSAIVAGQETRARHDLARLAQGVPLIELCELVVGPALRRIGEEWAAGVVSIAVEHRATAICERLIAARAARNPPGRPRGIAVTATPLGERHALPALMAAACLRHDSWRVHHLGADLPFAEVRRLARETGAHLVVLSAATQEGAETAAAAVTAIDGGESALAALSGAPGDSLYRLLELARAARPGARRQPVIDGD